MKRFRWWTATLLSLSLNCNAPQGIPYRFEEVDIRMDVEFRVGEPEIEGGLVDIVLQDLERVPDHFQSIGLRYGEVVLVDQEVTLYPEMAHKRGQTHPTAGPWDHVSGAYNPSTRTALIRIDRRGGSVSTAIHEFGHLIDHALGDVSDGRVFVEIWHMAKREGMRRHAAYSSGEFFADVFAQYFLSDETRIDLEVDHPSAYGYMRALDIDMMSLYERVGAQR